MGLTRGSARGALRRLDVRIREDIIRVCGGVDESSR